MPAAPEDAAPLLIRSAAEDDVGALVDLYEHLVPAGRPFAETDAREIWRRFSRYEGSANLLGLIGGKPISTCTLVVVPNLTRGGLPYALIENVVTHAGHRGRGYGKAVLDAPLHPPGRMAATRSCC